jgi:hypothetical protein
MDRFVTFGLTTHSPSPSRNLLGHLPAQVPPVVVVALQDPDVAMA